MADIHDAFQYLVLVTEKDYKRKSYDPVCHANLHTDIKNEKYRFGRHCRDTLDRFVVERKSDDKQLCFVSLNINHKERRKHLLENEVKRPMRQLSPEEVAKRDERAKAWNDDVCRREREFYAGETGPWALK